MSDRDDLDLLATQPIDDMVVPYDQFTNSGISTLRHHPAEMGKPHQLVYTVANLAREVPSGARRVFSDVRAGCVEIVQVMKANG